MNSENFQNRSLRNIFGKFATGVCAVSYYNKDYKPIGITVNSFTSVSLDPALALWCIDNDSELYEEGPVVHRSRSLSPALFSEWVVRHFCLGM